MLALFAMVRSPVYVLWFGRGSLFTVQTVALGHVSICEYHSKRGERPAAHQHLKLCVCCL